MAEKIIVFGATGKTTKYIVKELKDNFSQVLTPGRSDLDLSNSELVKEYIRQQNPTFVVNGLMARFKVDEMELPENQPEVNRINAEVALDIAQVCREIGAWSIYLSTDFVFDGEKEDPYTEEDTPDPLSAYGRSKFQGEQNTLTENPEKGIVVRLAFPYTDDPSDEARFILSVFNKMLDQGSPIGAVEDKVWTPTLVTDLAKAVRMLVEKPTAGIWHVAGDVSSPLEMVRVLAEEKRLSIDQMNELIQPKKFDEYQRKAPEPKNSALDNSKFSQRYSFNFTPLRQGIKQFVNNLET